MNNMTLSVTKSMRRDWDARARKNAFHYIASWRKEWDLPSFLASGEEDVERLVVPASTCCEGSQKQARPIAYLTR